jgi:hypothetical protein
MWTLYQHPAYLKNSATREGFAMWMAGAGGFMGMVIRVSQFALLKYQAFALTKSMVKKLYSKRTKTKT